MINEPPVLPTDGPKCLYCGSINSANASRCWVCGQTLEGNAIWATVAESPALDQSNAQLLQVAALALSVVMIVTVLAVGVSSEFDDSLWPVVGIGIGGTVGLAAAVYAAYIGLVNPGLRRSSVAILISVFGMIIALGLFVVAVGIALLIACISAFGGANFH